MSRYVDEDIRVRLAAAENDVAFLEAVQGRIGRLNQDLYECRMAFGAAQEAWKEERRRLAKGVQP